MITPHCHHPFKNSISELWWPCRGRLPSLPDRGLHVPNLWIRAQAWALLWTMNCEQKCVSLLGQSFKSQKSLHHALCSLYHLTSTVSNRGCSVNPGPRVKTAGRGWTGAQMTSKLLLSQAPETLGVFLNTAQPHLSALLYLPNCQIT